MPREETNEPGRAARNHGRGEIRQVSRFRRGEFDFRSLGLAEEGTSTAERRFAGSRAACHAVAIECVRGDPSRHQDHGHPRTGVGSAARQVKAFYVRTAIGRLEGPQPAPVGCDAVNGAIQDAVALDGCRQGSASRSTRICVRDVGQSSRATQLFEDGLAIGGEKAIPVVMRAEVRRVDQHIQGFASGGATSGSVRAGAQT